MTRGAPPGAQNNGLPAASWWVSLGECDPRVTGHLLRQLGQAGIPAYAQPSLGQRGSYLELRPPHRPMDSIHVDNGTQDAARTLLAGQLGDGEPPSDAPTEESRSSPGSVRDTGRPGSTMLPGADSPEALDAQFAAIVAGFHAAGSSPASTGEPPAPRRPWVASPEPGLLDPGGLLHDTPLGSGSGHNRIDPFDGDNEHYVPPKPAPVPPMHPVTKGAVVAIVTGIVLLLAPAFLSVTDLGMSSVIGALLVGGGTLALVLRLRDDPPDHGDDGGAVV